MDTRYGSDIQGRTWRIRQLGLKLTIDVLGVESDIARFSYEQEIDWINNDLVIEV